MISIVPRDSFNEGLLHNVHPDGWVNPTPTERYNLVVIGGGTAGLIAAAVASSLGAKTALIERQFMGGDCLNVGCVPSKGLIRGARGAAERKWQREAGLLVDSSPPNGDDAPEVDFSAVMERLRRIRSEISGHDSAVRYRDEFGVDVFIGNGTFDSRRSVTVAGADGSSHTLTFSKALIATGARAAAPPIPGLDAVDYLTNENVFNLTELPNRLVVIGAGPIGCEMAQSFARLGSTVEVIEIAPRVLPREDADVAETVQKALLRDGVRLHLSAAVSGVRPGSGESADGATGSGVTVTYSGEGGPVEVHGDRLLVAIGRAPNIDGLGLDAAGVRAHKKGIDVNKYLQTSNRRIYAAGDVATPFQFTHIAEATASIVVQNALFARTARFDRVVVPWSTYTSPEVAHVGLSESEAARDGIAVDIYSHDMALVDRARLDGETDGFVKILVQKGKSRILGATVVGAHGGELLAEVVLAMQNGLGVEKLAGVIHPYPTHSEAIKRAAAGYLKSKLTPTAKKLMNTWFRWRRF